MKKNSYIHYNTTLTKLAKRNRRKPTVAENKLWFEILRDRPEGYKFTRQKPISKLYT